MDWTNAETDDNTQYKVVLNEEEQYSIWPEWRDDPIGWRGVGQTGTKAECLAYIESVWTDMRPLSLRKAMDEASRRPPSDPVIAVDTSDEESLPLRLSRGSHPVALTLWPDATLDAFRHQLDNGCVHVKFTQTQGGTELGLRLDAETRDRVRADVEQGQRLTRLSGGLKLDGIRVRCVADIDLTTFAGSGHLEVLDETPQRRPVPATA